VIKTTDEAIREIVRFIDARVNAEMLTPDWRGDYFSSNQLDDLRKVLEKNGFETAKIFVAGKIKSKGNQIELKKNMIIIALLEKLADAATLDMQTKSYIIGKLNPILAVHRKEVGKI
jgi:hypothetical protein